MANSFNRVTSIVVIFEWEVIQNVVLPNIRREYYYRVCRFISYVLKGVRNHGRNIYNARSRNRENGVTQSV